MESQKARKPESHPRIRSIWHGMKARISKNTGKNFKFYKGKGITVCEEWKTYENFKCWALSNDYFEDLTLDRIDNNGNYEPSNCRWVTYKIQQINRSNYFTNTTGFVGILRNKHLEYPWTAVISVNRKNIILGTFKTPEEASEAYEKARKERDEMYWEEFNELIKNRKNDNKN